MSKHIILFLAANPLGSIELGPGREARTIQEELERSGQRDRFELVTRWAVQPLDLIRELRKLKPTVVHFSGQGASSGQQLGAGTRRDIAAGFGRPDGVPDSDHLGGLFLQGPDGHPQIVTAVALQETFGAAGASVKLVVLNACYSDIHVEALLVHIDCVVAMGGSLRGDATRAFAIGFYGGLGERQSVAAAYLQGCAAISLTEPSDCERPRLAVRAGIDASQLVLADTRAVDRGRPIPAYPDVEVEQLSKRVEDARVRGDKLCGAEIAAKVTIERKRWWMYTAVGVTAAAAVALVVLLPPRAALALNVEVKHTARSRGDEASVGDIAHITVPSGENPRQIRVYREGQLVLRCPGDPRCRVSDASTEVDLMLPSAGTYTVVAPATTAGLPPLTGTYDADTAAAKSAGIDVLQSSLTVAGELDAPALGEQPVRSTRPGRDLPPPP